MDITNKIHSKIRKILKKLKNLGIIQDFRLEISFCIVDESLKRSLIEIDSVLKKCLRKIITKPRRAEIRNIITELVRKKNLNDSELYEDSVDKAQKPEKVVEEQIIEKYKLKCKLCEKNFTLKKNFLSHLKIHEQCMFLCDKCGVCFSDIQTWKLHRTENEEFTSNDYKNLEKIDLSCTKVEKSNGSLGNFSADKENFNNSKGKNELVCDCGKSFKILKSLRKHQRLKHSQESIKYSCENCKKTFFEKSKLNRHKLSHQVKKFTCKYCQKQFFRSDTMRRHISIFHQTHTEFPCSVCDKKFSLKFNKDVHEESVHKSDWIYCEHCGRKFRNKIRLRSHLRTHSNNKITCASCSKSFSSKSYYKIHWRKKHLIVADKKKSKIHAISEGET